MILGKTNRRFEIAFLTLVTLSSIQFCESELFTAVIHMEDLFETEAMLINHLEAYVAAQENKLTQLRRRISEYQREHDEAAKDITTYIANPINAFLLTKRLTTDWAILEQMILHNVGTEIVQNVTLQRDSMIFPSDIDFIGTAAAIIRLQNMYFLDTASLARGEINGVKYSSQMSSHDCFEMGRHSYLNEDYHHTILWMNEAIVRWDNNTNEMTGVSKADILGYILFSVFKQGDTQSALEMTNELLKLTPDQEHAKTYKRIHEMELAEESERKASNLASTLDTRLINNPNQQYEKLCRGEIGQEPQLVAQLKCRYLTNKPFLKIAPLKLEQASLKPNLVFFHDVIYDNEIDVIQKLSKPRFESAGVQAPDYRTVGSNIRSSKVAWLNDQLHDIFRNVGQRIEDMTGLTVATAEDLQVLNYGMGGHYDVHIDYALEDDAYKHLGTGNRILTILLYMSDVAEGGATVFPAMNVTLYPRKGMAVFWYNLHASGKPDDRTRHAACPVLLGSKWVANKLLHERGQEFLRPCELEPDHLV